MNKSLIIRWIHYIIGMAVLAVGLVLNTKTGLGTPPIISIAYSFSLVLPVSFADLTLVQYCIFVLCEFMLKGDKRQWKDILQVPLSIVFTRFMNVLGIAFNFISAASFTVRIAALAAAIICCGVGSAMAIAADIIPNPGDGFVHAVSIFIKKDLGLSKNIVDISCVLVAAVIGYAAMGTLAGVGIGTVASMLLVGRVVALFNITYRKRMAAMIYGREAA